MNIERYQERLKAMNKKHGGEIRELMAEFANSNSSVKVGDFFADHLGVIKVESIGLYMRKEKPSLIFFGTEHTKKLQPKKSGAKRQAYQISAITRG